MNDRRPGGTRARTVALLSGLLLLGPSAGAQHITDAVSDGAHRGPPAESSSEPAPEDAALDRYLFDPAHTYIGFSARHMLVTRVRGRFKSFEGEILYNPRDPTKSSAQVTIDVASLSTDHDDRDDHLRSSDFFHAEKYPTITFESTAVERDGDRLVLVGDLTIKETTRSVRIPFVLRGPVDAGRGTRRIGAEAEITVNRFDWGLRWDGSMKAGDLIVGEEAVLELDVEAVSSGDG